MIENIVEYLQNLTKRDIKPGVYTTLQFPDSLTILEILHAIGKKLGSLFSDTQITTTTTTTSGGDADVQVTGDVNSLHFDFTIPAGGGGGGGSGDVTSAGNNRFTGKNTFVQSPVVPNPTNVGDAANKAYVDTEADAASADAVGKAKEYTNGEVQRLDGKISNEINAIDGRVDTLENSVTQIETKQAADEKNIQTNANDIVQLSENQSSLQESVQQLQNGTLHKMESTGTVGQYWRKSKTGDAGEWQDGDGGGGGSTSTLAWLPEVDVDGNLSWTQSTTTTPPETRNIKGADGAPGATGATGATGPQGPAGTDGISPTAKVTQTETGARISITDKDGTTTADITNGTDGTPGTPGATGPAGADGFSPTANVTQTVTGARISITDKDRTTTADITNGTNGAPGATGPQGPAGVGVPTGGTTGQVLAKKSNTDYDTEWVNQSGGGGGGNVPTPPAYANRYLRTKDAKGTMEWGSLPISDVFKGVTFSEEVAEVCGVYVGNSDGTNKGENLAVTFRNSYWGILQQYGSNIIGGFTWRFNNCLGDIVGDEYIMGNTTAGGTLILEPVDAAWFIAPFDAELYNGPTKVGDVKSRVVQSGGITTLQYYFDTPDSFPLSNMVIKHKLPIITLQIT